MNVRNRMLWRDLWHLRGQAVAAALVIACGLASFLSMRGTYESLQQAQQAYYADFRFADVFAQLKQAPASMATSLATIPGVTGVQTRIVQPATLDVPGLDEPASGRLVSIPDTPRPILNDLSLRAGRYVDSRREDEIIASEAFAAANHLQVGDSLGAVVNGHWKRLRIAGIALSPEYIYEVGAGTIFPDNRRFGVLWMAERPLATAYGMQGSFNDISLKLMANASVPDVIARVDALLAPYGGQGAYGRNEQLSHQFISDEISQNRVMSSFVPGIFLGVGAFLLNIILGRLMTMQRTEIGLLKAFGYSNGEVALHYLKLALTIVMAGALAGVALGVYAGTWLAAVYRDYYRFPHLAFHVSLHVLGLTLLIALAAAGTGALGAVRHAMLLPPAQAMRPLPPPNFQAGLLERSGFAARLPSSVRMILRNILRRRLVSTLAVLGLACAVGILLIGKFAQGAMDYLMEVQFQVVQREDVMVSFFQPRSHSVSYELGRLPGVMITEPFRSVPVRLRADYRTKRLELTGFPPDGELHRLVDRKLQPVALPLNGVVLTRKLGELLGIRPGQTVSVSVLEGTRPTYTLQVTGLVDEPIGLGAYMDLRALNTLMREQGSLSGAYLAIDPSSRQALYQTLKRLPAISGVAFRDAMLESFNKILNRSMRVTTMVDILFACIIAFGVVYNSARISLSERGNELASLRVLGFSRREVALLLLGEQAVLTLLALPLGLALGAWASWLLSLRLNTELYRIPLVLDKSTFAFATAVIVLAALASGLLVIRRLNQLDLIAVLKTRE